MAVSSGRGEATVDFPRAVLRHPRAPLRGPPPGTSPACPERVEGPSPKAVIASLDAHQIDLVFNLGDCLSGPLWPVETAELLIALDWPTLAGNHERQMLDLDIKLMGETDAATARQLTPRIRDWMRSLPSRIEVGDEVLLCHGTPAHDDRYWLHRGRRGAMREATESEIAGDAVEVAMALCGHSHLSRQVTLPDGRIVANPGSVGLPAIELGVPTNHERDDEVPHARYLIAERHAAGWAIELCAVAYDFELSARKAEVAGRARWAEALRTGRVR